MKRTLKELYQIVLDNLSDSNRREEGICTWIESTYYANFIDGDEFHILIEHFESQKPTETLHSEFFNSTSGLYWWNFSYPTQGVKNMDNVRVRFITHIITNLPESQS